jgi:hypothetical protein
MAVLNQKKLAALRILFLRTTDSESIQRPPVKNMGEMHLEEDGHGQRPSPHSEPWAYERGSE